MSEISIAIKEAVKSFRALFDKNVWSDKQQIFPKTERDMSSLVANILFHKKPWEIMVGDIPLHKAIVDKAADLIAGFEFYQLHHNANTSTDLENWIKRDAEIADWTLRLLKTLQTAGADITIDDADMSPNAKRFVEAHADIRELLAGSSPSFENEHQQ